MIAKEKLTLTRRELQEIVILTSKLTTQLGIILTSKDDHLFSSFGITKVTCGWIPTGHDKDIETTGSRISLNIVGAINLNSISTATVKRYEALI